VIQTHADGGLRTVVLDRPDRRNALTREGLRELREVVSNASEPVLHLTGAGEAFCGGADLDTVADLSRDTAVAFARQGQQVAAALSAYDGAVVAGVTGAARGGGVELALACDVRVATPDSTFAESGVSLGLFGAWGGTARLPAVVGQGYAMDLALSGRVIDAETAASIGLVSRVVDDPGEVAAALAANDDRAVRTIKRLLRSDRRQAAAEEREAAAFGDLVAELDDGHPDRG